MADFDSDWKITGSPDPATPDPQPHQTTNTAQTAAPVYQTAPTTASAPVTAPASVYTGAVQQQVPSVQASGFQRTATGFVPSQQQIVQNANLTAERDANIVEINKMINHFLFFQKKT